MSVSLIFSLVQSFSEVAWMSRLWIKGCLPKVWTTMEGAGEQSITTYMISLLSCVVMVFIILRGRGS